MARESKGPSILVPRLHRLRKAKMAMRMRMVLNPELAQQCSGVTSPVFFFLLLFDVTSVNVSGRKVKQPGPVSPLPTHFFDVFFVDLVLCTGSPVITLPLFLLGEYGSGGRSYEETHTEE